MRNLNTIALILVCVLLGAAGQITLKLGASSPALAGILESGGSRINFVIRALLTPKILFGLTLYAISTMLWLQILARTPLSFAYPFISVGFIVTALFGWLALGETMSAYRVAGVMLIVTGLFLIARS